MVLLQEFSAAKTLAEGVRVRSRSDWLQLPDCLLQDCPSPDILEIDAGRGKNYGQENRHPKFSGSNKD
uniref:Uncharacterized protein n=1 Tax=Octopus bimaculoides TaxID=37653 RepID=A0A0L8GYA7_OCTBM